MSDEEKEDLAPLMLQEPEVDAEEDDDESEDGDLKAVSDRVLADERSSVLTTEDFMKAVSTACPGRPEVRHQLLSAWSCERLNRWRARPSTRRTASSSRP